MFPANVIRLLRLGVGETSRVPDRPEPTRPPSPAPTAPSAIPRAQRDLLLGGIAVERAMQPNVVTIDPEATVMAAARSMRRNRVNCLPVVERGKLVGIVTAFDLLGVVEILEVQPNE